MAFVGLQTETSRSAQREAPSGQEKDPLAGMTVLTAEGQEPAQKGIQITATALKRIRIAMAKENVSPDQGGLRVGIQGGGCSGLSYNVRFDSTPHDRDRVYFVRGRGGDGGRSVERRSDPRLRRSEELHLSARNGAGL
jgi:iron-sulfur cluster assembly protein